MKKKALPSINWNPASDGKLAGLQRWLLEWKLGEETASEIPDATVEPAPQLRVAGSKDSLVAPFDKTEPVRGEVRLLSSRLLPGAKRPVYVLVLEDWEDGMKLVAPFGPLLEPATRSELKTGRSEFCLSVLCLWNVHSVPVSRLQWGWVVDQFSESELEEAWSVFRHAATGSPLNPELEERVGLPILDPEDPRTIYQNREFDLLSPLSAGILLGADRQRILHFPAFPLAMENEKRALAAGSDSSRFLVEHLRCTVPSSVVSIVFRPDTCQVILLVHGEDGALSDRLSGAEVVDGSGLPLAKVHGAFAGFSLEDGFSGIGLRGITGELLELSPAETFKIPNHSAASLLVRACNPEAPALVSDSQLALLFSCENLPMEIEAALSGEILFRLWLYRGEGSPSLNADVQARINPALREAFGQRKDADGLREIEQNPFPEHSSSRTAWAVYSRRVASFLRADGLIPVLVGATGDEAVPIPFLFRPGLPAEIKVMDAGGCILENWSRSVCRLEAECVSGLGFVIDTHVGTEAEHFGGGSFALPVLIAKLRAEGDLPDFYPLRLLASGVVRTGALEPARGLEAKAALARRIGAQFLSVGDAQDEIPVGTQMQRLREAVFSRLQIVALQKLTPRQLRDAIRLLGEEVRNGQITLTTAERRLSWHREALKSIGAGGLGSEARLLALSLQGAICNHKGDADLAARLNAEAREEALRMKNPRAYVEASANQVVSFTDLRLLSQAEDLGRRLLSWVRTEMQGSEEDRKRAEITAAGALGGQPLLHAALAGGSGGQESLELLEHALQLALEIEDGREVCFDAVQVAGWHALLKPATADQAFHEAHKRLSRFPKASHEVSMAYLLRVRFLGAYRHWLATDQVAPGFETWDLPPRKVSHLSWVLATALKYRATLFAANGQFNNAASDFKDAASLLERQAPPVLRFISATASLRAFLSLRQGDPQLAEMFLKGAENVFTAFERSSPGFGAQGWLNVCAERDPESQEAGFRREQRAFPY